MAVADLNLQKGQIDGFDSIVLVKDLGDIPAGVTLNVSDVTEPVIKAGHVLIQENSTKEVKPLKIEMEQYVSLPGSHTYYGILKTDILTSRPMAPVLRIGTVNAAAAEKHVGAPYTQTIVSALNKIDFLYM